MLKTLKNDTDRWECPEGCDEGSNWIEFFKNDYRYVRPCPIHRSDWEHPEIRAAKAKKEEAAREEAKSAKVRERREW